MRSTAIVFASLWLGVMLVGLALAAFGGIGRPSAGGTALLMMCPGVLGIFVRPRGARKAYSIAVVVGLGLASLAVVVELFWAEIAEGAPVLALWLMFQAKTLVSTAAFLIAIGLPLARIVSALAPVVRQPR